MKAKLLAGAALTILAMGAAKADPVFINSIVIPTTSTDLSGQAAGANGNRLGGFFSDLYYDRATGSYYGLTDRGPGGGTLPYDTRVQQFSVTVNPTSGAISNFQVQRTVLFTDGQGNNFNGLNPTLATGNPANLGRSFDPEGFVVGKNGTYFVSDEYGPSVKEFSSTGQLIRTFTTPANLIPTQANSVQNFTDGRPTITSGRQDNRGFEGLTMTPDGKTLVAVLQDPLVNEGAQNDGRRSQNLRIVTFDVATGQPKAQYAYQLESIASINGRIPGTADDFSATAQGRNIGVSSITAINDHQFLLIERDNRGVGVTDTAGAVPVGSKRVFLIDTNGATDISNISMANSNTLPNGVTPVSKQLFLDIQAALIAAGLPIPEKIEGLTIGPQLADGSFEILIGTDNDYSVTQNDVGTQFDVCADGTQVTLDSGCGAHGGLLPTYLYAFKVDLPGYVSPDVSAPSGLALLALGALASFRLARRKQERA